MYELNKTFKIMRDNKIVHIDIKLDNILIKNGRNNILNFTCKLTDFGTSKKKQMILQFAKLILEHQ